MSIDLTYFEHQILNILNRGQTLNSREIMRYLGKSHSHVEFTSLIKVDTTLSKLTGMELVTLSQVRNYQITDLGREMVGKHDPPNLVIPTDTHQKNRLPQTDDQHLIKIESIVKDRVNHTVMFFNILKQKMKPLHYRKIHEIATKQNTNTQLTPGQYLFTLVQ